MFCSKCGVKLLDGSRFCSRCGVRVQLLNTVHLTCQKCGGTLAVDEEKTVLLCPYCGSKELIIEDGRVTAQRIKSETYKEVELRRQEIESKKIEREIEKERKKEEKEKVETFKKGKLSKVILVFSILCAIMSVGGNGIEYWPCKIIAMAQSLLFLTSWLIGTNIIKVEKYDNYPILYIIAFVLMIPLFILMP